MKNLLIIMILMVQVNALLAQNERKVIRQGYRDYMDGDYDEAEIKFRKAEDIDENSFEARFNTGASLYEQKKYDETLKQYGSVISDARDPATMAAVWHNIGNSLLESKKYAESIEAYKNSLRLNPGDEDTRYNLAYAQKMMKDQQQQQQQQQQQDKDKNQQDKDQQQDQNKQNKEQQQNQDQQQQQQQQQPNQDQQQSQEQQAQEDKKEDQPQKAQPLQQLSKEDAQRMLEAIMQQEKDVKEKVDKKKAATARYKTDKDW